MLSRSWVINLFLAALVVFLGINAYGIWSEEQERLPEGGSAKGASPFSAKTFGRIKIPPQSEYDAVVSHNLFSMERLPDGDQKGEANPAVKAGPDGMLVKLLEETIQQISIYGVMIVDDEKRALIKSPATPVLDARRRMPAPHAGEEIKWVKVGDGLNRFTVNEIKSTGVVLGAEGLVFDVALYDKDKPKERSPVPKAAGPIVIGGEDVPGAAAVSGVAKEAKKEGLPEPAAIAKAALLGKEQINMQRIAPKLDNPNSTPFAVPSNLRSRLLRNRPGPDQR